MSFLRRLLHPTDTPPVNSAGMSISEEAKEIEQTDNSPKPEDGPQDISQDPELVFGP